MKKAVRNKNNKGVVSDSCPGGAGVRRLLGVVREVDSGHRTFIIRLQRVDHDCNT